MNPNEIKRRFPNASAAFIQANDDTANNSSLRLARTEQAKAYELASTISGTTKSAERIRVQIVFVRRRLWRDRDNYSSAAKDIVDGLRYAALIPGDSEAEIDLEVSQQKSDQQECSIIEIDYP